MKLVTSLLLSALVLGWPAFAPVLRAQSPAAALTTLHTFQAADATRSSGDGSQPRGSLLQGSDGNFYGTTAAGGAHGTGTIFQLTPEGVVNILYSFGALDGTGTNRTGALPDPGLILGYDGNLYGTTAAGGAHGSGTVFLLGPEKVASVLHHFDAAGPRRSLRTDEISTSQSASLLESSDGSFYGTTAAGGTHGAGTVFRLTRDGIFITLHAFAGGADGAGPAGGLLLGSDGNLYGTTAAGGTHGEGTVFQMTQDGTLTILHSFDTGDGGVRPLATLVQGNDGSLFGTTSEGGTGGTGTVFRLGPNGILTTLYRFSAQDSRGMNDDGAFPQAALLPGGDGSFYGTTAAGGKAGAGTVYRVTRAGVLTVLHDFSGTDGADPQAALVRGSDGFLYGTTAGGGANGQGTSFRVNAAALADSSSTAAGAKLTLQTGVGTPTSAGTTALSPAGKTPTSPLLPILPGRLPIPSAAVTSTWLGGTDVWSNAARWVGGIPDSTSAIALIDGGKTGVNSVVTLDSSRTVGALTVDKGDALTVANNTGLTLSNAASFAGSGTLTNNGTVTVGDGSSGYQADLLLGSPVSLVGTGTIRMAHVAYLYANTAGNRLTIGAGATIAGLGNLGASQTSFTNNGTVTANSAGNTLLINPGGSYDFTNGSTGITDAVGGGILQLNAGVFQSGAFSALDGSQVLVTNATVSAATLATAGSGLVTLQNSTLASVTNAGAALIPNNTGTTLTTSFTNNGTVTVGDGSNGYEASLALNNPVGLGGTGTIRMATPSSYLYANNAGDRLTIGGGETIAGLGQIGAGQTSFTNNGTVTANVSGQTLLLNPGTNDDFTSAIGAATRAENGATLELGEGAFDAGTFAALAGSQIRIDDSKINNATLTTTGTGLVFVAGRPTLTNVTSAGAFVIPANIVAFANGTLTNNGTFTIGDNSSGYSASLIATGVAGDGGTLQLAGTGTFNLIKSSSYIYAEAAGDGVGISPGTTVAGLGNLGAGQTNFLNLGVVTANVNGQTLVINPGGSYTFNNFGGGLGSAGSTGSARAENGGILQLNAGTFAGGSFSALDASQLQVVNATVSAATLATAGSGLVTLQNSTLASVTNAGAALIPNNTGTTLTTSFTNNGTVTVGDGSNGYEASLALNNPVGLGGTGTIRMATPSSYLYANNSGDRLTINAGTEITGLGQIGIGQTSFTNYGVINASGSGNFFNIAPGGNPDANKVPASFINSTSTVTDPTTHITSTVLGTVEALNGGTISFTNGSSVPVTNQGLFQVTTATKDNSSFTLPSGSLTNLTSATPTGASQAVGTLTGGTYLVAATGATPGTATLSFGGTGEINVNAATVTINGNNAAFADFGGLTDNQGSFSLLGQRAFTTASSLMDEGILTIDAGSTLQTQGDFTEASTSVLTFLIGGTAKQGATSPGVLSVEGNANLAGVLALRFSPGATLPRPTDVITIGSVAAMVSGSFANVAPGQTLNTADALGSFEVDYGPNAANPQLIVLTNFGLPSPANPPVINSALTAKGTQGQPFTYTITGSNSPTDFVATALPAGLTLDVHKGVISGTPTTAGTTTVALTAHNGAGNGTATLVITIAASAPVIGSPGGGTGGGGGLTAAGVVGTPFTYQISAQYNPTSYGASRLPTGLSLNATTGAITGTPQTAGTYPVTISATNSVGTGNATLTITITNPAPSIGGSGPGGSGGKLTATGQVGVAFSYYVPAGGVVTSYTLTNPPPGLSINATTGQITGTPTTAGTFTSTVSATNSSGTGSATLTTTITPPNPPPPVVGNGPGGAALTASGQVAVPFSFQIPGTNYPTNYNATGLPAGLSVNFSTGVISGTPTTAGTFTSTVYAGNISGSGSTTLTITIAAGAPVITSATSVSAGVGAAFTYTITATNNPTVFGARGLPSGLTINTATGVITGTPIVLGTYTVNLTATNAALTGVGVVNTGSAPLTITVAATAPVFGGGGAGGASNTATAIVGQAFAYQIVFSGRPTSYGTGTLPPGLVVDTGSGIISGVPTTAGVYTVSVSAFNAQGSGAGTLTINVVPNLGAPTNVLHDFAAYANTPYGSSVNTDGAQPLSGLILGSDGNFYGTTYTGGAAGYGTVYKLTPSGVVTVLHSFTALGVVGGVSNINADGANPEGKLVQDASGNLFGTTLNGGINGNGTIFKVTTAGVFTSEFSFGAVFPGSGFNEEGAHPTAGLILGSDGHLYGTTNKGGSQSSGTVFLFLPDTAPGATNPGPGTVFPEIYLPSNSVNGYGNGPLVQGSDGNFYGTTYGGGANGKGAIYQVKLSTSGADNSGTLTTLYSFTGSSDGSYPFLAGLVEGPAGTFYGTTSLANGTTYGAGTVFQFTVASRTLMTLHTFSGSGTDGYGPQSGVTKGLDGNLYGTTHTGGGAGYGTIFRVTTAGAYITLHSFGPYDTNGNNVGGQYPVGTLLQGSDGTLYGTAQTGGAHGTGTVFSLTLGAPTISSAPTAGAVAGVAFSYVIAGTGGPTSFGASGLPAGLSLNTASGLISGTPTTAGTYTVTLSATNAAGTGTGTLTLTVNAAR